MPGSATAVAIFVAEKSPGNRPRCAQDYARIIGAHLPKFRGQRREFVGRFAGRARARSIVSRVLVPAATELAGGGDDRPAFKPLH